LLAQAAATGSAVEGAKEEAADALKRGTEAAAPKNGEGGGD